MCDTFIKLNDRCMSAIGIGTWLPNSENFERMLDTALEIGYRHIDTAQYYNNEESIGKVLKKWFDSGRLNREDVFIATKLKVTDAYPEKVENSLKESLRKLQLEYVDLFSMHFPVTVYMRGKNSYSDPNVHYTDVWKKMEEEYDAGRAKQIGVSNFNIKQIQNLLSNCRIKPVNNQIELHVYMQQRELVDFCHQNDITVVAYAPLGCRSHNQFLEEYSQPGKKIRDPTSDSVIVKIASKYSKTPAQVIFKYLIELGVAVVPTCIEEERIKENYNIFDFSLDHEDMEQLRALDVGEDARVVDWRFLNQITDHSEYPFSRY